MSNNMNFIIARNTIVLDGKLYESTSKITHVAANLKPESKETWFREQLQVFVDRMKAAGAFK